MSTIRSQQGRKRGQPLAGGSDEGRWTVRAEARKTAGDKKGLNIYLESNKQTTGGKQSMKRLLALQSTARFPLACKRCFLKANVLERRNRAWTPYLPTVAHTHLFRIQYQCVFEIMCVRKCVIVHE